MKKAMKAGMMKAAKGMMMKAAKTQTVVGTLNHLYKFKIGTKPYVVFWVTPKIAKSHRTSLGSITASPGASNDDLAFLVLPTTKIAKSGTKISLGSLQLYEGKQATLTLATNGNLLSVRL